MLLFMDTWEEIIAGNFAINKYKQILYSLLPNKYRETEGTKDIGSHFWNFGRTQEIKERVVHLGE